MELIEIKNNNISDYETERGKPMPDLNHSIIQGRLMSKLDHYYGDKFTILPEINLELPIRDRVPDLAIYPPIAFNPDDNEIRMSQPPLCAVEILSEMQSLHELLKKRSDYFIVGIKSYWLVVPALRNIYVFDTVNDYTIFTHKDTLKDNNLGIELDLKEVFK